MLLGKQHHHQPKIWVGAIKQCQNNSLNAIFIFENSKWNQNLSKLFVAEHNIP
jgi:hypothetical protein